MPEVDIRDIIVAFNEKGWNLYELNAHAKTLREVGLIGPVDNLVATAGYVIVPIIDDPTSEEAVNDARKLMEKRDEGPIYKDESGEKWHISGFLFYEQPGKGQVFVLRKDSKYHGSAFGPSDVFCSLEDAAMRIRKNLSSHEKTTPGWERMWRENGS